MPIPSSKQTSNTLIQKCPFFSPLFTSPPHAELFSESLCIDNGFQIRTNPGYWLICWVPSNYWNHYQRLLSRRQNSVIKDWRLITTRKCKLHTGCMGDHWMVVILAKSQWKHIWKRLVLLCKMVQPNRMLDGSNKNVIFEKELLNIPFIVRNLYMICIDILQFQLLSSITNVNEICIDMSLFCYVFH